MKHKALGETGTQIPVIGLGMGMGGYLAKNAVYEDKHAQTLLAGIELGMTFIDTAEVYGMGHCEEVIGNIIKGLRKRVFLSTKFSPENSGFQQVLAAVERSLTRLRTDHIDLYQMHWPNPNVPMEETIAAMEQLTRNGKVRYLGVSNLSLKQLKQAQSILKESKIVSIQVEYNLFDRSIEEEILPYCQRNNITVVAYSPLIQGKVINGGEKFKVLQSIAQKYGKTPEQIALQWLVSHPSVVVIPNTSSLTHLRENAASADFELEKSDFDKINELSKQELQDIPTNQIRVVSNDNQVVYRTIKEAKKNDLGHSPSPMELAEEVRRGDMLKPIQVVPSICVGEYAYDLTEGRTRYWAWVIAHDGEIPIPAYVQKN